MFYVAASICPGLNFSDSGGQSKVCFSCADTESSADFRIPASANCCTGRSTEVCRSAASVLIVTSVMLFLPATVYYASSPNQQILRAAIISAPAFSSVNPSISARSSMPCSARSSSVQTPRAASLNAKSRSTPSRFSRSSAGLLSPRLSSRACAMVASAF